MFWYCYKDEETGSSITLLDSSITLWTILSNIYTTASELNCYSTWYQGLSTPTITLKH